MSTSLEHERYDRFLGLLLSVLTEELNIDMTCGGRTTLRQEEAEKGMEPDNSYWIENEPRMRTKDTYDPAIDPPPDLVWEIEVSRSVVNRLGILAALKVPEVWRYDVDAATLWFGRLLARETYESIERSVVLPMLTRAWVLEAVSRGEGLTDSRYEVLLDGWIRAELKLP